ncbi:MAG: universal stress protein [Bacteroidota bacterium]
MNRILCPVDFSSCSINAIEYAFEIGVKYNAHLTLLYVFTEDDFNKVLGEDQPIKNFNELLAMAKERLKNLTEIIKSKNTQGLVNCDYSVALGEMPDRIINYINDEEYNLVVLGTTGISKVTGVYVGSNAIKIIESSPVPVICVPEQSRFQGFDKVVYATDYNEEDRKAIQDVISFATSFDSKVNVVHITHRDNSSNKKDYEEFVSDLGSFVQYDKLKFDYKVYPEELSAGMEEYLNESEADMLVMLTHKRSTLEKFFHRSMTRSMTYITNHPLMILKY